MDSRCILRLELTRHVSTDAMKEGGHTDKERGVGEIFRRCPCPRAWRGYVKPRGQVGAPRPGSEKL